MQKTFSDSSFKEVEEKLHKYIANNNLDFQIIYYKNYAANRSC